jgi:N-acyl homoserine lactone hydrolase
MAAHELYLLHLGQLGLPDADTGETHFAQVPGYLIRTASGRTVLVDTGNPLAVIGQPTAAPWWDRPNDTRPQDDVVQRLAELGIAPGDVDLLISTHFDFDHCGRHDLFAGSGITPLVQREHLDAARDDPRLDPALWDIPGIAYSPVDGDVELEPGLRLIASPGHVIGHQSVYVETGEGAVLLAIDAISVAEQITMKRFPSTTPDPEAARRARDKLVALAAETGAFLLMGHDAQQWATLVKSPAPFRRP